MSGTDLAGATQPSGASAAPTGPVDGPEPRSGSGSGRLAAPGPGPGAGPVGGAELLWLECRKALLSGSVRTGAVIAVLGVGLLAALYAFFSREVGPDALGDPEILVGAVYLAGYRNGFIAVLLYGIWSHAGEATTGMLANSLLTTPRRHRFLAAKSAATVALGGAGGAVLLAVSVAVGVPFALARSAPVLLDQGWVSSTLGWCVVGLAAWSAIGLGLGLVIGRQLPAVVATLIWVLLLEPVVTGLLSVTEIGRHISRYLPVNASAALSGEVRSTGEMIGQAPVAAAVLCAYGVALTVLGGALASRRDVFV